MKSLLNWVLFLWNRELIICLNFCGFSLSLQIIWLALNMSSAYYEAANTFHFAKYLDYFNLVFISFCLTIPFNNLCFLCFNFANDTENSNSLLKAFVTFKTYFFLPILTNFLAACLFFWLINACPFKILKILFILQIWTCFFVISDT